MGISITIEQGEGRKELSFLSLLFFLVPSPHWMSARPWGYSFAEAAFEMSWNDNHFLPSPTPPGGAWAAAGDLQDVGTSVYPNACFSQRNISVPLTLFLCHSDHFSFLKTGIPFNYQLATPFVWCIGDPLGTSVNTRDCLQRNCVFPVLPAGSHHLFFNLKKSLTPWEGNQTVLRHQDKMLTVPYTAKPAKHEFNPNLKLFLNT